MGGILEDANEAAGNPTPKNDQEKVKDDEDSSPTQYEDIEDPNPVDKGAHSIENYTDENRLKSSSTQDKKLNRPSNSLKMNSRYQSS